MFATAPTNIILGLVAGMTIFLGLPVARIKRVSETVRGMLALASAGVLFFLIIEVGYHAIETLEMTAKSGDTGMSVLQALIMAAGLALGLIGLAAIEAHRYQAKNEGASPLEIANMIAIGIGLHNFAEGLAIGQSYSSGNASLGLVLVLGFALHNATEGFGIAGPLAGLDVSWSRLFALGLIAGVPTAFGALMGGTFVNTNLELFILSLAVGSLIYVTRELLRLRFTTLSTTKAMVALTCGLFVGIASEIYIEAASVSHQRALTSTVPSKQISFAADEVEPGEVTIIRGDYLSLTNESDKPIEIESKGLTNNEIFIPKHGKLTVQVTGSAGEYTLSPEDSNLISKVTVLTGQKNMQEEDTKQIIAALTILEGHVRAAYDLHMRAISKQSTDPKADLARAGKHAYHPIHETLEGTTPLAKMTQSALRKINVLDDLKSKLENFSKLAGDKNIGAESFSHAYADLLGRVEKTRQQIAGDLYDIPAFRASAAYVVLHQAEDEYKDATESGKILVEKVAEPGKDGYLEYQDTRGFLKATRTLLASADKKNAAQEAIDKLINDEFKEIDPKDPNKPTAFENIEERFETVEDTLAQFGSMHKEKEND